MRKVSVIAITVTYLDMTFATTVIITSVVETGGYFVRTVICTIIWASFPMSHVDDMRGDRMRLIDADKLKEEFPNDSDWDYPVSTNCYVCEMIDAQPTIEPERKKEWTPCSDGLPEEDHWLGGSGRQFSDEVLVSIANYDDENIWTDISQTIDGEWALELPSHCKIIAWMPLPLPYQGEGEEE